MSKTIKVKNKRSFLKNFLIPLSKIAESAILELKKEGDKKYLTTLSCTSDNSVIFYNEFHIEFDFEENIKLNFLDIKKFIRAVEAIDLQEDLIFELNENNVSYKDKNLRFKYHLIEDDIIKKPKIDLKKLKTIDFCTNFNLKPDAIKDLVRGSVFASDSNTVYLSSNEEGVYADLTDKTKKNIDNVVIKIANEVFGKSIKSIPLSFDIFRIMETSNNDIIVKINEKIGIVIFEIDNNYSKMIYMMSALIK